MLLLDVDDQCFLSPIQIIVYIINQMLNDNVCKSQDANIYSRLTSVRIDIPTQKMFKFSWTQKLQIFNSLLMWLC